MTPLMLRRNLRTTNCFALVVAGLLLLPDGRRVFGHNGAVAVAYPVSGITVDGDLSDWPEGLPSFPVALPEYGVAPRDDGDLTASFRAGYGADEGALYVAVEVHDDSTVVDPSPDRKWTSQDGCTLYLDVEHEDTDAMATQFELLAEPVEGVLDDRSGRTAQSACQLAEGVLRYEWRIDLKSLSPQSLIVPGVVLSFDLAVYDKDADGSYSWVSWGRRPHKIRGAENRGDLVLVSEGTRCSRMEGSVTWSGTGEGVPSAEVRFRAASSLVTPVQGETDLDGVYAVNLPEGEYVADIRFGETVAASATLSVAPGAPRKRDFALVRARGRRLPLGPGTTQTLTVERSGAWFTYLRERPGTITDVCQTDDGLLWIRIDHRSPDRRRARSAPASHYRLRARRMDADPRQVGSATPSSYGAARICRPRTSCCPPSTARAPRSRTSAAVAFRLSRGRSACSQDRRGSIPRRRRRPWLAYGSASLDSRSFQPPPIELRSIQ